MFVAILGGQHLNSDLAENSHLFVSGIILWITVCLLFGCRKHRVNAISTACVSEAGQYLVQGQALKPETSPLSPPGNSVTTKWITPLCLCLLTCKMWIRTAPMSQDCHRMRKMIPKGFGTVPKKEQQLWLNGPFSPP